MNPLESDYKSNTYLLYCRVPVINPLVKIVLSFIFSEVTESSASLDVVKYYL